MVCAMMFTIETMVCAAIMFNNPVDDVNSSDEDNDDAMMEEQPGSLIQ